VLSSAVRLSDSEAAMFALQRGVRAVVSSIREPSRANKLTQATLLFSSANALTCLSNRCVFFSLNCR
jgi:hypothetical protein